MEEEVVSVRNFLRKKKKGWDGWKKLLEKTKFNDFCQVLTVFSRNIVHACFRCIVHACLKFHEIVLEFCTEYVLFYRYINKDSTNSILPTQI